jgi:hypothetical protein
MIGSRRDYSVLCPVKDYFISGDELKGSRTTEFVSRSTPLATSYYSNGQPRAERIIRQPDNAAAILASVTVHGKWQTQSCS